MKIKSLGIMICLLLSACNKGEDRPFYDDPEAKQIIIDQTPLDFKVPSSLWDAIEALATDSTAAAGGGGHGAAPAAPSGGEHGAAPAPAAGHGEPAKQAGAATGSAAGLKEEVKEAVSIPVVFTNLGVYLKEKTEKTLKKDAYHIQLPKGGGEVDFANLVGERNGSFFLAFDLESFKEASDFKIYFVSEVKKRKVGEEILGAGCNKYFDVTSLFTKTQKEKGLLINTTRLRHLSVLGGHFVFVGKKEKQIFLSQLSFKDSKNSEMFCEREI